MGIQANVPGTPICFLNSDPGGELSLNALRHVVNCLLLYPWRMTLPITTLGQLGELLGGQFLWCTLGNLYLATLKRHYKE